MKSFRVFCVSIISLLFITSCAQKNTEDVNNKPNIIYILADDTGIGDIGAYNKNSKIPTPNLDQMAAQGIKFTDAHSPSSVCTPTRYSVLTGRYSWRSRLKKGVLRGYDPALIEEGRETVASLLKASGYKTAGIGKWHIGLGSNKKTDYNAALSPGPIDNGFDYYYGIPASLDMPPYVYFENDRVVEPANYNIGDNGLPRGVLGGEGFWRGGKIAENYSHIDVLPNIISRAEQYIKDQQGAEKPYFLYLPLPAPHQPWLPTDEFKGKSDAGAYGDFMYQLDSSVGQIIKAVENIGQLENTLIIFTSDNASHWYAADIDKYGHHANLHYRGHKGDIYEGGHRVPFIAHWPKKIPKHTTSDDLINLTDLLATVADIVNITIPNNAGEDSVSILPALLNNSDRKIRETTVLHSMNGTFAIRKGHWKLIEGPNSGGFGLGGDPSKFNYLPQVQLYNLASDPSETTNLYKKYPKKVAEMQALLAKIKAQ